MIPALMLWLASAQAEPVTYTLDPAESSLYVVVYADKERFSVVAGHDHVVVAETFTGEVTWDADGPSACSVAFDFPVTALVVDPPGYRDRAGLDPDGAVGDGARKKIAENMLSKTNLWGDEHPRIAYSAASCPGGQGKVPVEGTISIRGVGKTLTVPMTVEATADRFRAVGETTLEHGWFGMKPYTLGPMTPKNAEAMRLVIEVSGRPAATP